MGFYHIKVVIERDLATKVDTEASIALVEVVVESGC